MRRILLVLFAATAAGACTPPPPAPEGLDEASRYMVRNFWADDATFEAGVQGFVNWFEIGGGKELTGLVPGEGGKETDAFTVSDLRVEDVEHLPIFDPIELYPRKAEGERMGIRDIEAAAGVVSVAEMDCTWQESEGLLLRTDQDTMFPRDWDAYERNYVTPRATYEGGTTSETFTPIEEPLDPFAEDFDPADYADTLLFTDNSADPTPILFGIDMGAYPLDLDFRHGLYDLEIDGEVQTLGGFMIITYNRESIYGDGGANGLRQSYSIEINLERPNGKTLRMLAVWAEPVSDVIGPDNPLALNYAVSKSRDSSIGLSKICAGETEIPDEPAQ